jgi:hypothetical protein
MKKLIAYILLTFLIAITLGNVAAFAYTNTQTLIAQDTEDTETTEDTYTPTIIPKPEFLPGPTEESQEEDKGIRNFLVKRALPAFAVGTVGFVGGLSLIFLVIAGVRFAVSYGNEEAIEKAKNQAIYALIGLLIAMLSYTVVAIISNIAVVGE